MKVSVPNPWPALSRKPPFILAEDRTAVAAFNQRVPENVRIIDDILPVPFLGRPDAPVVLLNLNAGHHPDDHTRQTTRRFTSASRRCLSHENLDEFPFGFYYLDEKVEGPPVPGPGHSWWYQRLNPKLIEQYGIEAEARTFLCVQYFPYRSREFRDPGVVLESQRYGFELVRAALRRRALIIIMRSAALWLKAVPELAEYPRAFRLKNPRNPKISPGNCRDGFPLVEKALRRVQNDRRDEHKP